MTTKPTKSLYSVHPRVHTMQNWMAQLESRTGRSFEAWVKLVKGDDAFSTEREQREWLRRAYGLGVTSAMHIAAAAQGYGADEREDAAYLENADLWARALFSGRNQKFRPVFEELVRIVRRLGPDVRVCPVQTHIPVFRKGIFASIAPETKARLGLTLKITADHKPKTLSFKRLERKGMTIVYITDLKQADADLYRLLEIAYQQDH
jgi:hypothetical protein